MATHLMKALVALAITQAVHAQPATLRWARVTDPHGSSFEMPVAILKRKVGPSGILTFEAEGGAVQVQFETVTESRLGFPGNDPGGDMDLKRSDCTRWPPTYRVVKTRLGAYSCVKTDKVSYYVARYSPWGSVTLMVDYPRTEAGTWDPIVKRMAASMRQVERHAIY